ncbi:MAG: CRISPR-associated protein Cas4 [Lentisphaeria bacterium]|nr:CRISPR-associated protein Cas4 [Lentisphaeria bacterium]
MNESTYDRDDDFVTISALQHYLFCRRQCALIHLENAWEENKYTAEGRILHEHVDAGGSETRKTLHMAKSVRLFSRKLGITGIADIVEFHLVELKNSNDGSMQAIPIKGLAGLWKPFPVEYKRGKPKKHRADEVQLCAQAICLEEMLNVNIPSGALFYGETRHRNDVSFDDDLRTLTQITAHEVHNLLISGMTPEPTFGKWCATCSLGDICAPKQLSSCRSVRSWFDHQLDELIMENRK